jgi:hypothetical protein
MELLSDSRREQTNYFVKNMLAIKILFVSFSKKRILKSPYAKKVATMELKKVSNSRKQNA